MHLPISVNCFISSMKTIKMHMMQSLAAEQNLKDAAEERETQEGVEDRCGVGLLVVGGV